MSVATARPTAHQRGYSAAWRRFRLDHLRAHPFCVSCLERGQFVGASVVDHRTPHRGDPALFWDPANLQSLCKPCHDGPKQAEEHGHLRGCDVEGWPLPGQSSAIGGTGAPGGSPHGVRGSNLCRDGREDRVRTTKKTLFGRSGNGR